MGVDWSLSPIVPELHLRNAQLSGVEAAWRPQIGNLTWASSSADHAMLRWLALLETMMIIMLIIMMMTMTTGTSQYDDLVHGNCCRRGFSKFLRRRGYRFGFRCYRCGCCSRWQCLGNLSWFYKKRINSNWQQLQRTPGERLLRLTEPDPMANPNPSPSPDSTHHCEKLLHWKLITVSVGSSGVCLSVCLLNVCLWCAAKVQKVTPEIELH